MSLSTTPSRLRALAGATALLLLTVTSFAQGVDAVAKDPAAKDQVIERVNRILTKSAFVPGLDFKQWEKFLDAEKEKIGKAKSDEEFSRAVNEALTKFGASHIYLASPRAAEMRRSGSTVGIGISSQTTPEGVLIVRTVPGAAAQEAGLVPGDLIVEVDGKPVEGIKGIPGAEGTTVKLKVKHADGKTQDYTLTRRKFSTVRPEELVEVDKNTARLSVYTFDFTYDRDNVESLMKKAQKYPNLILDLRDNGGGAVINLQHLLGLLVPAEKTVGTFVNRRMVDAFTEEKKTKTLNLPEIAKWSLSDDAFESAQIKPFRNRNVGVYNGHIAVLVNALSGSASEIAAAALKDTVGATVVGSRSAGAVLVSVIVPASNGYTLQYPIMDYVTISGKRLEGAGVTPDIEANEPKYRLPNTKDEAVEKAILALAQINSRSSSSGSGTGTIRVR